MSVVTARMAHATFTVDGKEYGCQIVDLTLGADKSGGDASRRTLCGDLIPEQATYADRLTGTVVQDWPAPGGGLIGFTRATANRGRVVPFTLTVTDPADTYSATGTVQIDPLDVSINPNETAESDVDWTVVSLVETFPPAT